jgi:hypothetical protein
MMIWVGEQRWNDINRSKPKNSEKACPSATLSTTNHTWIDPGANPRLSGERPDTNDQSHGTAHVCVYSFPLKTLFSRPTSSITSHYLASYRIYSTARHWHMWFFVAWHSRSKLSQHHIQRIYFAQWHDIGSFIPGSNFGRWKVMRQKFLEHLVNIQERSKLTS